MTSRTFTHKRATRESVPVLVGLMGPSGSGKTYSALRIASGIQEVTGGDIFVVDTEARRALHYADTFKFEHIEFTPPFSPLDYLAAIEYAVDQGAATLVVDSMSHEHEGPGGVLEWHEAEQTRLAEQWKTSRDKTNMSAWGPPKSARRKLINRILQMQMNAVFCFRAKEKVKVKGGKPEPMGWMPVAGEEFLYEMTVNALLPPGAAGHPRWVAEEKGEDAMIKLPEQFRKILLARNEPLDEQIGRELAEWAAGDAAAPEESELMAVLDDISEAKDKKNLRGIAKSNAKRPWTAEQRGLIKSAIDARSEALDSGGDLMGDAPSRATQGTERQPGVEG